MITQFIKIDVDANDLDNDIYCNVDKIIKTYTYISTNIVSYLIDLSDGNTYWITKEQYETLIKNVI